MGFVFIRAEPQDCVVLMYSSAVLMYFRDYTAVILHYSTSASF